ncbi:MAG TPA: diguanylate cyclase [Vicinamibacterales bacterium]|nr:diguanylate cyclase [Vicinamibacterales bacterium]
MQTVALVRSVALAACALALAATQARAEAPRVVIESARVNGATVDVHQAVDVPDGAGNLEVTYASPNAVDRSRLRFSYRLEGFDSGWVDAGLRRTAYYTNIPPGRYTFRVIVAGSSGVALAPNATLPIQLRPRFYQTATFFTVCVLGAVFALMGAYRWRLRVLRDLQADLMRLVRERTEELEEANRRLAQMSYVDALTNVSNRRSFDGELALEWRRSTRTRAPLSLLLIDIDGFKGFNDALGHHAGDDCLRKVAAVIAGCVRRAGDTVARYGGEEFAVLLPETDRPGATALAERIRAAVEGRNLWHPGSSRGRLTVSIGVATRAAREDVDPAVLVREADAALYRAKGDGRNLVRAEVPETGLSGSAL